MIRALIVGALATALVVLAVSAASGSGASKRTTGEVHLGDTGGIDSVYYNPTTVTIHKGDRLNWIWDTGSVLQHSVYLKLGPDGVRYNDFRSGLYQLSPPESDTHHFKARFRKRGTYKFLCQAHPAKMKMTVTVKR